MRLIAAFFKLIRLPNLFFIALTQVLFQFCIYYPLYRDVVPEKDLLHFIFLVLASLFIAAAGYVINDYFDINIDEINKPHKMVVDKVIHRRGPLPGILYSVSPGSFLLPLHFLFFRNGI